MNKQIIVSALVASCIAALAGCTHRPVEPQFVSVTRDTVLRTGPVACTVRYDFVSIDNARRSETLQAIEDSNIWYFFQLEEFTGTAGEAAAEALRRTMDELTLFPAESAAAGELFNEAVATVSTVDSVLVYSISRSSYDGGAHPMHSIEVHNYRLSDGCELMREDFFSDAQLDALTAAIRTKLCGQYGVTGDEGLAEAGFFPEAIGVSENFTITPEGIVFHYNPYDIGCYALGSVDVVLTKAEIGEALR